jgi:hypothetical protein
MSVDHHKPCSSLLAIYWNASNPFVVRTGYGCYIPFLPLFLYMPFAPDSPLQGQGSIILPFHLYDEVVVFVFVVAVDKYASLCMRVFAISLLDDWWRSSSVHLVYLASTLYTIVYAHSAQKETRHCKRYKEISTITLQMESPRVTSCLNEAIVVFCTIRT